MLWKQCVQGACRPHRWKVSSLSCSSSSLCLSVGDLVATKSLLPTVRSMSSGNAKHAMSGRRKVGPSIPTPMDASFSQAVLILLPVEFPCLVRQKVLLLQLSPTLPSTRMLKQPPRTLTSRTCPQKLALQLQVVVPEIRNHPLLHRRSSLARR